MAERVGWLCRVRGNKGSKQKGHWLRWGVWMIKWVF